MSKKMSLFQLKEQLFIKHPVSTMIANVNKLLSCDDISEKMSLVILKIFLNCICCTFQAEFAFTNWLKDCSERGYFCCVINTKQLVENMFEGVDHIEILNPNKENDNTIKDHLSPDYLLYTQGCCNDNQIC